jgi:GMP synthase (glutamine-hydrolysing)
LEQFAAESGFRIMAKQVLVFQHVPHEHLGHFAPALKREGVEFHYLRSFENDLANRGLADLGDPDALIFLGGPMSANDEAEHAFIRPELNLIEEALERNKPLLGICLGAQLIAKALGARVYAGMEKEIGWYDLELTEMGQRDPLFAGWPRALKMFQWHGETFELPRGAQHLARSARYRHQAFRFGEGAYGLQFHPEITLSMIEEWLEINAQEVAKSPLPRKALEIKEDSVNAMHELKELGEMTAENWARLLTLP